MGINIKTIFPRYYWYWLGSNVLLQFDDLYKADIDDLPTK
jgi:hypothetical protein